MPSPTQDGCPDLKNLPVPISATINTNQKKTNK